MPIIDTSADRDCSLLERQYVERAACNPSLSPDDFFLCVRKSLGEIDSSEKLSRLEIIAQHATEWAAAALKNGDSRLALFNFQLGRAATELLASYSENAEEETLSFPKIAI